MSESKVVWRPHPDYSDVTHGLVAGRIKYLIKQRDDGFALSQKAPDGRFVRKCDPFPSLKGAQATAEELEIETRNA